MLYEKIELEADEKVIVTVRKHWFVITMEMLAIILMGLLPVAGCLLITALPSTIPLYHMVETILVDHLPVILFMLATWLLLTTMAAVMSWTHYFLDLWVITDRRIIVIEQFSFFNRKVSNFRLERLQDIKVTIKGLIPTLLNFGTIRAQTASAAESNFESNGLPDPRGLQSLIQSSMDARLKTLGDTPVLAD